MVMTVVKESKMNREEKLKDIQEHPDKHFHTWIDLQACCIVDNAIDCQIMDAHPKMAGSGSNGGNACDVTEGPCACGGWH